MRYPLIVLLLILLCSTSHATKPTFLYDVDFLTYFDNREYKEPYNPQTIFAFRLSPTVGVGMSDPNGGAHRLMAGVHYTQSLGGNWENARVLPTAYYQYKLDGFSVNLGAIPFSERIETMPDFLFFDSIAYARPNVQGALLQYESEHGFAEMMCDWHSAQYKTRREMFRIMLNGQYAYKCFWLGALVQMHHKANAAEYTVHEGVCDDIHLVPHVGLNLSQHTPLDSLSIKASYIYSIQRERKTDTMYNPQGMLLDVCANWRFLGLKNTLYIGENLMPFYAKHGTNMNLGDPFYDSKLYNRTDVFVYLFRNSFVNCYFSWNMHYVPQQALQHQQQLVVQFDLDGFDKTHKLKGIFGK